MADLYLEDPVINSQRYAIMSYILPNKTADPKGKKPEGHGIPMVKFRGAFSTVDECQNKIISLQKIDKYFNFYIIEVGKWGCLQTDEQLRENKDIETVYSENKINEMFAENKAQKDKADEAFAERTEWLKKKAIEDGTKEGQERLANQRENPMSLIDRIENSEARIKALNQQLNELEEIYSKAQAKLGSYTQEELDEARKKLESLTIEN